MKVGVIGASGVVGRALLERLADAGIPAIGFSRRAPDLAGATHIPLDLLDAGHCADLARGELGDVTHLVYTALFEKPGLIAGWLDEDQMRTNLRMLENVLSPLARSDSLRHVTLLQGTKAYGAHVKPMRIPGRERDPRVEHPNFYWLQEDYVRALEAKSDWNFTIWRPQIVFGHALGAPMNMVAAIGVYAALKKHRGQPLAWPGGTSGIMEATDADLLAEAIMFSFDNPRFSNETFNVTNGDVFTWENLWPTIVSSLGCEQGEPSPERLAEVGYDEDAWREIAATHDLAQYSVRELVGDSFFYADALFSTGRDQPPPPAIVSTIKLRQAGFHRCIDTEDMLAKWFGKLREMKILPP